MWGEIMLYEIVGGKLQKADFMTENALVVEVLPYTPGESPVGDDDEKGSLFESIFSKAYSRYETYESLDIVCINQIFIEKYKERRDPVYILVEKKKITFYSTDPDNIDTFMCRMIDEHISKLTTGDVLYYYMFRMIHGDLLHLEDMERQLTKIETHVTADEIESSFSKQILKIKKHLLWIGMYYEQFLNLLADLSNNMSGLYNKSTLKKFKMLDSKIDRLYSKTKNLLNYATEIRSTYQAEVDLQLNKTMKALTVITVIVSPLTLIVGWYGMNLQMPEFSFAYSYPILIAVCVTIVVGSIVYFKKNKWF